MRVVRHPPTQHVLDVGTECTRPGLIESSVQVGCPDRERLMGSHRELFAPVAKVMPRRAIEAQSAKSWSDQADQRPQGTAARCTGLHSCGPFAARTIRKGVHLERVRPLVSAEHTEEIQTSGSFTPDLAVVPFRGSALSPGVKERMSTEITA
jgi:hypothetical protein